MLISCDLLYKDDICFIRYNKFRSSDIKMKFLFKKDDYFHFFDYSEKKEIRIHRDDLLKIDLI